MSGRSRTIACGVFAAAAVLMLTCAAQAQIRDAVYRGTLVCDKLPFFETAAREAIEVTISGSTARYSMVVRDRAVVSSETGGGNVDGMQISLKGSWQGTSDSYEASYAGTFVRRSAKLTGSQVWQHEGATHTRRCAGVIKRPFAIFLPRKTE